MYIADLDYNSTAIMIVFGASEDRLQTMCVPLPIIDDLIANEADEEFLVTLKDVFPVGNIGNSDTCVTVIDDDSKSFYIYIYIYIYHLNFLFTLND